MSTTSFHAEVLADSVAPTGIRLTTMILTYPRFIHAELMTHRVFSRNAASSRAIPTKKKIGRVRETPVEPVEWGSKKAGMQAGEPISSEHEVLARDAWHRARMVACESAEQLDGLNVHKQVANRILEPWDWMTTIFTSTKWRNFDFLRIHPAADPNAQKIARLRKEAYDASTPRPLHYDEWHMPYVSEEERKGYPVETLKIFSAARCARLSYLNHDGARSSHEKDLEIFNKLTSRTDPEHDPGHWTPLEHQATPIDGFEIVNSQEDRQGYGFCDFCYLPLKKKAVELFQRDKEGGAPHTTGIVCEKCALGHVTSGNLVGWKQFRKEFQFEDFDGLLGLNQ